MDITQILVAILTVVVTPLMGYIVWLLKEQKKDRTAQEKGIMLLLRVQLIEYHDKYVKKLDAMLEAKNKEIMTV